MYHVYLSLGTNLGNRKRNIREAIEKIGEQIGVVERQSALYETKPWGYSSPNDFINSCVLVLTTMAPRQVLEATQRIEREMGRTLKSVDGEYHDRIIDIDILMTIPMHFISLGSFVILFGNLLLTSTSKFSFCI